MFRESLLGYIFSTGVAVTQGAWTSLADLATASRRLITAVGASEEQSLLEHHLEELPTRTQTSDLTQKHVEMLKRDLDHFASRLCCQIAELREYLKMLKVYGRSYPEEASLVGNGGHFVRNIALVKSYLKHRLKDVRHLAETLTPQTGLHSFLKEFRWLNWEYQHLYKNLFPLLWHRQSNDIAWALEQKRHRQTTAQLRLLNNFKNQQEAFLTEDFPMLTSAKGRHHLSKILEGSKYSKEGYTQSRQPIYELSPSILLSSLNLADSSSLGKAFHTWITSRGDTIRQCRKLRVYFVKRQPLPPSELQKLQSLLQHSQKSLTLYMKLVAERALLGLERQAIFDGQVKNLRPILVASIDEDSTWQQIFRHRHFWTPPQQVHPDKTTPSRSGNTS